jgi:pseudaminic acid biosynthesis-associated methylase
MRKSNIPVDQEMFWQQAFGCAYTDRNIPDSEARTPFFKRCLEKTGPVESVLEIGANRGHNLQSIKALQPNADCHGLEINPHAYDILKSNKNLTALLCSVHDFVTTRTFDLVFSCGVLIHLAPESLPDIYKKLYEWSARHVIIIEYFNPQPVELDYWGHQGKLFKRDFGGEFWDVCGNNVELVDYGFLWKRVEPAWDNPTWWIFRKK